LHHLLAGARAIPERPYTESDPVARLLALAQRRTSALAVEVAVIAPDATGRPRDVALAEARPEHTFHPGDPIQFAVWADRDCHLALIDIGTTCAVTVLVPNARCPVARLHGGRQQRFPGPELGDYPLIMKGRPGLERLIAIATHGPLPIPLGPMIGEDFRRLDEERIEALVAAFEKLDPAAWGASAFEFTIGATRGPPSGSPT
jgi:hypothetical protein